MKQENSCPSYDVAKEKLVDISKQLSALTSTVDKLKNVVDAQKTALHADEQEETKKATEKYNAELVAKLSNLPIGTLFKLRKIALPYYEVRDEGILNIIKTTNTTGLLLLDNDALSVPLNTETWINQQSLIGYTLPKDIGIMVTDEQPIKYYSEDNHDDDEDEDYDWGERYDNECDEQDEHEDVPYKWDNRDDACDDSDDDY